MIDHQRGVASVSLMCRAYAVSVSGYYAWRNRGPSQRHQQDTRLLEKIRALQETGRGLYGSDRIYKRLHAQGVICSRKRIARLMRENGLNSRRRRKYRHRTTDSNHNNPIAPNILARDFAADHANQKWVGDILGIRTDEGWLYLAALLDTFSRMIVGWAMSIHRDEQLVEDALYMAIQRRRIGFDSDLLHHSDRGSQYTAKDYQNLLTVHGIEVSMSRKGDPYDNAMIESFFSTLRAELTELEHFSTISEARLAVFDYLEVFYNRQRIHSSINYMTPLEFETFHLL